MPLLIATLNHTWYSSLIGCMFSYFISASSYSSILSYNNSIYSVNKIKIIIANICIALIMCQALFYVFYMN